MKPSHFLVLLFVVQFLEPARSSRKEPPKPLYVVQALKPKGLRISIADEDGMDTVKIHASVNVPLDIKADGQITQSVEGAKDGFWTLHAPDQQLKPKDVVFFWAYISVKGDDRYVRGRQQISDFVEPSCLPSVTTVNGRAACRGALVLEENFDSLNTSLWQPVIQFSDGEHVFATYVSDKENLFTKDGVLHLKATVVEDIDELKQPLKLEGCTGWQGSQDCERTPFAWDILPPTRSAWLRSSPAFAYRFGRLEIRLKAAAGDWIRSKFTMYPRAWEYGESFNSGVLEVVNIFGNAAVHLPDSTDNYGARRYRVQIMVGACELVHHYYNDYDLPEGLFSDDFHTYSLTWTPKNIKFEVDGIVVTDMHPPRPGGFLDTEYHRNCENSTWEKGTFMAPFDKEFYFNFELLVAGHWAYGDGSTSGGHTKPYTDKSPRGPLEFWRARNEWGPTWKGDYEIDYVKVWAL